MPNARSDPGFLDPGCSFDPGFSLSLHLLVCDTLTEVKKVRKAMQRKHILSKLEELLSELQRSYKVQSLGIFGSVARGEAVAGSDLDILVSFKGKPTYDGYIDLKLFLEEVFQAKVDLVTEASLDERIRPYVEKDLIRVA